MTTPASVQKVFAQIDAMSLRERAMVAATVFAILWALWDALLMQPLNALEDARQQQVTTTAGQISDLTRSIQSVANSRSADPDGDARRRVAELSAENVELDAALREVTQELVPLNEMAALLESVIERTDALALTGMQTLPAEPIIVDGAESGYFRHGLAVDVRGGYLDALRYLEALEKLRWRFFWESVELEVTAHPTTRIRIVVYTLGQRPGAIGV